MYWPQDLADYLCSALIQILIPTILLIATPKWSAYRYVAIPCMIGIASRFIHPVEGTTPTRCQALAFLIVVAVQAVHLLLINPMDNDDISREKPKHVLFLSGRVWNALKLLTQTRAVNSPRQVKNVPPQPKYYSQRGANIARGSFLLRQSTILVWQYLTIDIFQTLARRRVLQQDPHAGFSDIEWFIPLDQWIERVITNLMAWFVTSRLLIDAHYRLTSIIYVGLGLDTSSNWPPAFGRMLDAYTLRNFWGKFWHQFLRQPFTSFSNFIARNVLRLRRPSILERYTNIFIVFLLSGVLHVAVDIVQTIPLRYSGSMMFFLSMVLGIIIEDGVQALFKGAVASERSGSKKNGSSHWHRAVGLAWVMTWLGVTSTWYYHPMYQLPQQQVTLVPFSVSERVGIEPMVGIVGVAAVFVSVVFDVEV